MVKQQADPDRRRREIEEKATESFGRNLVALDRLAAHLRSQLVTLEQADDEHAPELLSLVKAQCRALHWAIPVLQTQAEVEIEAVLATEDTRQKWGVHSLPDAVPDDAWHGRAVAHARALRAELDKMTLRMPSGNQTLAQMYGRFLDAVVAAIEEHARGYYWEQVTTPPQMVLRDDGTIVLNTWHDQ